MKRCAILFLVLLSWVSFAHAEKLRIYSDVALTDSTLNDHSPRVANLYIVHDMFGGTGIRFRIAPSAGFTGVWLSETSPFVTVGNSGSDLSIGYGSCLFGPVLVLTVTYQFFGTSSACSEAHISPPPGFGCVLAASYGCAFVEICVYDLGVLPVNCPIAVESTTWGRVKALYR